MEIEYDDQVLIVRNYISQEFCKNLTNWANKAVEEGQFEIS